MKTPPSLVAIEIPDCHEGGTGTSRMDGMRLGSLEAAVTVAKEHAQARKFVVNVPSPLPSKMLTVRGSEAAHSTRNAWLAVPKFVAGLLMVVSARPDRRMRPTRNWAL